LTNFILKDLTEEKEMQKLLHLLKNTQTDRMKTHKEGKRKNKHTFICITIASKSIFLITYYIINARK